MTPERLQLLLEKYLANSASAEEEQELMQWYQFSSDQQVEWPVDHQSEPEEVKARMLGKLQAAIHSSRSAAIIPFYKRRSWQIAASLLFIAGTGIWFAANKKNAGNPESSIIASTENNPVVPGGNKATLTLADGTTIVLDTASNTTLAQQGTTKIIKLDDGQLAYTNVNLSDPGNSPSSHFNTIRTPNGGQYQVILPDGTRTWLNAASVLHFPISFSGSERKVQLSGEAYFEVAKSSSKPFLVQAVDAQDNELGTVEVLGTAFNLNAYGNEPEVKTTLVDGKVKVSVSGTEDQKPVILTHGMQASFANEQSMGRKIQVQMVDTDDVIAWKNMLFNFNNADIKTVMRQIARWYDVEVVYEGKLPDEKFEGEISRNSTLNEVFRILELSAVHFKVEGRRVTVMP